MRVWTRILLAVALLSGTSACGGGDDNKKPAESQQAPTEFGNLKPEDVRASPAEVADGFRELDRYAADVVAKLGADEPGTQEAQDRLLTIWESILGAVKANDGAAYSKVDAALQVLMTARGTAGKAGAQAAADTVKETGAAYLARFPGTGSAAPQSTASPSSSAQPSSMSGGSPVGSDIQAPPGY